MCTWIDEAIVAYGNAFTEDEARRAVRNYYENVMEHTEEDKARLQQLLDGHYAYSEVLHKELNVEDEKKSFWKSWWSG